MLEIEALGKKIILNKKTKLSLTFRNANFEDPFVNKIFSYPIEIPFFSTNAEIFGFLNHVSSTADIKDIPAKLYYKSIHFLDGKIQVLSNTRNVIRFNFIVETDFVTVPDKKLNEINLGGDRLLGADEDAVVSLAETMISQAYPDIHFNFPTIYNPKFLGEGVAEFSGYLNRYVYHHSGYYYFPKNSTDSPRGDCLVPQPYLMYLIKQIFADIGYAIAGEFVLDPDMIKELVYGNFDLGAKNTITLYPENVKARLTADSNVTFPPEEQYADFWYPIGPGVPIGDDVPYVPSDYYETEHTKKVIFDDDTSSGYYDNSGFYFEADGEYKITTLKQHTITFSIKLGSLLADDGTPAGDLTKNWFNFLIVGYVWNSKGEAVSGSEYFLEKTRDDMYPLLDGSYNFTFTKTFDFFPTTDDLEKYLTVKIQVKRVFNDTGDGGIIDGRIESVRAVVKPNSYLQVDVVPDVYDVNGYNTVYNMQKSVPIVACKDFLSYYRQKYNLAFIPDHINKIIYIEYFDKLLENSEEIEWTNKAEKDFERKANSNVVTGIKYLMPENELPTETNKTSGIVFSYNEEKANTLINIKAIPMAYCWSGPVGNYKLMPWIEEIGNSDFDNTSTNNRSQVRCMYYRGIALDQGGRNYPKALAYNFDINGNRTAEKTMELLTENGIVKKNYKNYLLRYNNSAEFVRKFLLNISDIKLMNMNTIVHCDFTRYVNKEVRVDISDFIEPATATLLKI